jgi:dimethylamine/trimethylamine dehydrogenase
VVDDAETELPCDWVVLVADREPVDDLCAPLDQALDAGRLDSLRVIGDADAPGLIAQAVFAGHRAARQLGETVDPDVVEFLRERA